MSTPKIMIISLDRSLVGRMCTCLQNAGYQASSAEFAESALADLAPNPPICCYWSGSFPKPIHRHSCAACARMAASLMFRSS